MLLHQGLINLELVRKILRWHHTGFNAHTKVRTTTKREAERVGKYIYIYLYTEQMFQFILELFLKNER